MPDGEGGVNDFLEQFAEAWRDARVTRLFCYALLGALVLALLAGAISDLTRPRVYVVREGPARA